MERLTYRSPLGNAVSYGACEDVVCTVRDCDKCKVGAIICRLCAYEDTMPLERAQELAQGQAGTAWNKRKGR